MHLEIDHILVPLDVDAPQDSALERAIALAADYRADVTLLHVVPVPFFGFSSLEAEAERFRTSELLRAVIQSRVRALRKLHDWRGVVLSEVSIGTPADEILEAADRLESGLIVLGMRARPSLSETVRAGTVQRVLRKARCPVFVVRDAAGQAASPEAAIDETALRWGLAA